MFHVLGEPKVMIEAIRREMSLYLWRWIRRKNIAGYETNTASQVPGGFGEMTEAIPKEVKLSLEHWVGMKKIAG